MELFVQTYIKPWGLCEELFLFEKKFAQIFPFINIRSIFQNYNKSVFKSVFIYAKIFIFLDSVKLLYHVPNQKLHEFLIMCIELHEIGNLFQIKLIHVLSNKNLNFVSNFFIFFGIGLKCVV